MKLCGSFEGQTILRLLSYVRIDKVEEVPLEILNEIIRSDGLGVMLQEKSFNTLLPSSLATMRHPQAATNAIGDMKT